MRMLLTTLILLLTFGCSEQAIDIPDNKALIDANTALIELNSALDAL